MSWRDEKRRMRRDLHEVMLVPAMYIVGEEDPLPVNVRVHGKIQAVSVSAGPAYLGEVQDSTPRIRFDLDEVTPVRGAIVSVETGEAYRVAVLHPVDDEFQFADVIVLSAAEAADLPVPE